MVSATHSKPGHHARAGVEQSSPAAGEERRFDLGHEQKSVGLRCGHGVGHGRAAGDAGDIGVAEASIEITSPSPGLQQDFEPKFDSASRGDKGVESRSPNEVRRSRLLLHRCDGQAHGSRGNDEDGEAICPEEHGGSGSHPGDGPEHYQFDDDSSCESCSVMAESSDCVWSAEGSGSGDEQQRHRQGREVENHPQNECFHQFFGRGGQMTTLVAQKLIHGTASSDS